MLYATGSLLANMDIYRSKHSGLHSAFSEFSIKTGEIDQSFGKMIGRAFESRLESDCEVALPTDEETTQVILEDSKRFLKEAERIFYESKLDEINF